MNGYFDTSTWTVVVQVSAGGISIGRFTGDIRKGITVSVNLFLIKGSLRFYLKGKEIWVHIEVSVTFDGNYKRDFKLLTF